MTEVNPLQSRKGWSSQGACNVCNLTDICLSSGVSSDIVESLSQVMRRNRTIQRGEYVYHAGDRFTGFFALKSGTAKLVYLDTHGYETIISVLLPGELQGFDGVASGRYMCSLVALETSAYCELGAQDLSHLNEKNAAFQKIMQHKACEQSDRYIRRIATSLRPAEERLALFLIDLGQRAMDRGFPSEELNLTLTRQEIGNHLGLAVETISRLLGKFEAVNLIDVQGKKIHIINMEALRQICRK